MKETKTKIPAILRIHTRLVGIPAINLRGYNRYAKCTRLGYQTILDKI